MATLLVNVRMGHSPTLKVTHVTHVVHHVRCSDTQCVWVCLNLLFPFFSSFLTNIFGKASKHQLDMTEIPCCSTTLPSDFSPFHRMRSGVRKQLTELTLFMGVMVKRCVEKELSDEGTLLLS